MKWKIELKSSNIGFRGGKSTYFHFISIVFEFYSLTSKTDFRSIINFGWNSFFLFFFRTLLNYRQSFSLFFPESFAVKFFTFWIHLHWSFFLLFHNELFCSVRIRVASVLSFFSLTGNSWNWNTRRPLNFHFSL